jgi:Na+-driven multidrug efflux pump
MFCKCIKVGVPMSLNNFFIILAWYFIATIAGKASRELGIIWGIGVNIYVLTAFIAEGFNVAVKTMASNMIGRKDIEAVKSTYGKFMILAGAMMGLFAIPMVIFPDMSFSVLNLLDPEIVGMREQLVTLLWLSLIGSTIETAEFVTWGVLAAGGDTKYPAIISQTCIWGLVVAPLCALYYLGLLIDQSAVLIVYYLMIVSYVISSTLMYRRYRSLRWYRALV